MLSSHDVAAVTPARRSAGYGVLVGAVVGVSLYIWIGRAVFVPITLDGVVEYEFVSASARSFLAIGLVTAVVLALAHLAIRRLAATRGAQPPIGAASDAAYLRPLWCFAARTLSLLNLLRPHGRFLAVLSYVVVDLRWWWGGLALMWLARNIVERLRWDWRASLTAWPSLRLRRWWPEMTIAVITIAWTVFGTPLLRSLGGTNGDEPKYVRYCENLYQGLGFDISEIKAMSALPPGFRPPLWRNAVLLAQVLPGELKGLASDAVAYVQHPSRDFNRARHRQGGFLDGKTGGMYQVHGPGVSFLMFPAYLVDRSLADIQPNSPAQWPVNMPTVNALFVGVYAAWTILIFHFLRKSGASTGVAWTVSLVSTLTMPASAFPFQYYPELAAGIFIAAVSTHLLFGDANRDRRTFVFGLLAGYLPWFHIRFTVVMAALAVGAVVLWRGQWRRIAVFIAGIGVPVALLSLYSYRITGSAMPSAVWMAEGSEANFNMVGMIRNSVAYLIDREWGLFAHSPVFLLALPGYWWLAKRQPRVAFLTTMVFFALLLPAAGKTLVQTTPMRLIVAVVPLGATAMIEVLSRKNRAVLLTFAVLLIVSLDDALSYNLHHYRHQDTLTDWSFSGWKVNLLFPQESRRPWQISWGNGALLVAWMVVMLALCLAPVIIDRRRKRRAEAAPAAWWPNSIVAQSFAATALFLVFGTAVSAAVDSWTRAQYLIPSADAAELAALRVDEIRECTLCLSSSSGALNAHRMISRMETVDPAVAARLPPKETPDYNDWLAMPGQIRAWYIQANGHPPADTDIGHLMYQWREDHVPAVEIRRRIFAGAEKPPATVMP